MKIKLTILFVLTSMLMAFAVMAQNVVSVANSTNTLKITYSDASVNVVPKRGAKITNPTTGTIIFFTDINMKTYSLDHSLITSPVTVNKNALAVVIKNYLN